MLSEPRRINFLGCLEKKIANVSEDPWKFSSYLKSCTIFYDNVFFFFFSHAAQTRVVLHKELLGKEQVS